jgi:hypothetical protein
MAIGKRRKLSFGDTFSKIAEKLNSRFVVRRSRAQVAFELVDFALRRRPHLGFCVTVERDDPPPLIGQRRAAPLRAAVMG